MQRDECNEAVYVRTEGRTRAVEVGRESTEELMKRLRKRWATRVRRTMVHDDHVMSDAGKRDHDSSRGAFISVSSCRGMHREPVVTRNLFCALSLHRILSFVCIRGVVACSESLWSLLLSLEVSRICNEASVLCLFLHWWLSTHPRCFNKILSVDFRNACLRGYVLLSTI